MTENKKTFTVTLVNMNTGVTEAKVEKDSKYAAKKLKKAWQDRYDERNYKAIIE